jgi:hypothetical protein
MSTAPHLHYSVISDKAGKIIEKSDLPRNGGSIGVSLNNTNTINPAQYDNYDPTPRYLDETRRAAQIMSGTNADSTSGGLPPDRQVSFDDRFTKWGSSPVSIAPPTAPDLPNSFDNRFGNWGSAPAGNFGTPRSPVLRALENYKRSAVPDAPAPSPVQGAVRAIPAFQREAAYSPAGDFFGNFPRVSGLSATPSPTAFGGSSSDLGMGDDFNAVAQRLTRLLNISGQFAGNSPMSPAGTAPWQGLPSSPTAPADRFEESTSFPVSTAPASPYQPVPPAEDNSSTRGDAGSIRVLTSRVVPLNGARNVSPTPAGFSSQPAPLSQDGPPLGLFTGQPMSDNPLSPSIWDFIVKPRTPSDDGEDRLSRWIGGWK